VRELEARGFLAPLPEQERFLKVRQGSWRAVFVKASKRLAVMPQDGDDSLVAQLASRGITPRSARKLVSQHERARIEEKIRLFDGLKVRGVEGAIRNRAGWLYAAIVHDYSYSAGEGDSRGDAPRARAAVTPPGRADDPAPRAPEGPSPSAAAFEAMWAGLASEEREAFEAAAVSEAPLFLQRQYHEGKDSQGTLWRVTRQRVLLAHFSRWNGEE
jgi:hypothetical protein